jgi:hypothetical protein
MGSRIGAADDLNKASRRAEIKDDMAARHGNLSRSAFLKNS